MRNIIYISSEFNPKNGANKSASDVLFSLLENKFKVHVFSFNPKSNLDSSLFSKKYENLKWTKVKRKKPFTKGGFKQTLKWIYRKVEDFFASDISLKDLESDLIIVNSIGGHDIIKDHLENLDIPAVNIFRGSPDSFGIPGVNLSVQDVIRELSSYNALIFVSKLVEEKWREFPEIRSKKTYFVPNCIEEEKVASLSSSNEYYREKFFDKVDFNIVYIASIQFRKGHDILIKAFPEIVSKIPNVKLHLIGKHVRPFSEEIIEMVRDLDFEDYIVLHGEKDNALEYLSASDLLVFPSRAEAMPRVLLEAMAMGTPIISSDVDGNPELVEHDYNGYLFNYENPKAMVDQIFDLFSNPEKREFFAKNGRSKYQDSFSRNSHIKNYRDVIDTLLTDS